MNPSTRQFLATLMMLVAFVFLVCAALVAGDVWKVTAAWLLPGGLAAMTLSFLLYAGLGNWSGPVSLVRGVR